MFFRLFARGSNTWYAVDDGIEIIDVSLVLVSPFNSGIIDGTSDWLNVAPVKSITLQPEVVAFLIYLVACSFVQQKIAISTVLKSKFSREWTSSSSSSPYDAIVPRGALASTANILLASNPFSLNKFNNS